MRRFDAIWWMGLALVAMGCNVGFEGRETGSVGAELAEAERALSERAVAVGGEEAGAGGDAPAADGSEELRRALGAETIVRPDGGGGAGLPLESTEVGQPAPGGLAEALKTDRPALRYRDATRPALRSGTMEIGDITVEGLLEPEALRAELHPYRHDARRCWEMAHARRPELTEATADLRLTIDDQGRVLKATVVDGTPATNVVAPCLTERARRWVVGGPLSGIAVATVPFRFGVEED